MYLNVFVCIGSYFVSFLRTDSHGFSQLITVCQVPMVYICICSYLVSSFGIELLRISQYNGVSNKSSSALCYL
ncbi:uncharacterized protein RJT20DRAFT_126178 [Scheffersomyces xylosifermentans]|uniref:uncharacterized protein n=1 Tax=Scheffersomyces xylosifermentans TaxID=1304137 RepID=UPI00315C665E